MKFLQEVSKTNLLEKFAAHRDIKYIGGAITKWSNTFYVALTKDEYLHLVLNSSPLNPSPQRGEFPLLGEAVSQFITDPSLLEMKHPSRGLSGATVQKYIEEFRNNGRLADCFVRDKDADMRAEGSMYVADGMHRLVAYGVWKNRVIGDNEVKVYFCTNQETIEGV